MGMFADYYQLVMESVMTAGIGTVAVKRARGGLEVNGLGKTPTGQNYIKAREPLQVKSMADPQFKTELAQAVAKMFAETLPPE